MRIRLKLSQYCLVRSILLFKKSALLFPDSTLGKRKDGAAQYPVEQMCDMHPDVCKLADQMREYFSSTAGATRCLPPTAQGVAPGCSSLESLFERSTLERQDFNGFNTDL